MKVELTRDEKLALLSFITSTTILVVSIIQYIETRANRYAYGPIIGEYISNFVGSYAWMWLSITAAKILQAAAKEESLKILELLSRFAPVGAAATLALINFQFEALDFSGAEHNPQFIGDMAARILGIALAYLLIMWSAKKIKLNK